METEVKLTMSFKDEDDNVININVDSPRSDLTEAEIKACMDLIVQKDIFTPKGLSLVSPHSAKVVETNTTNHDLVL
jgi:hypothetical protein